MNQLPVTGIIDGISAITGRCKILGPSTECKEARSRWLPIVWSAKRSGLYTKNPAILLSRFWKAEYESSLWIMIRHRPGRVKSTDHGRNRSMDQKQVHFLGNSLALGKNQRRIVKAIESTFQKNSKFQNEI
jgi:hypothetical protein